MYKYLVLVFLFSCNSKQVPVQPDREGIELKVAISGSDSLVIMHSKSGEAIIEGMVDGMLIYNYADIFMEGESFHLNVISEKMKNQTFIIFIVINGAVVYSGSGDNENSVNYSKDF